MKMIGQNGEFGDQVPKRQVELKEGETLSLHLHKESKSKPLGSFESILNDSKVLNWRGPLVLTLTWRIGGK